MAFVRRKVTEEDVEFLKQYNIESPYGHSKKKPKELVADEENDFYLFYIDGPGSKRVKFPMYFGFVWKKKYGMMSVYIQTWGPSLKEMYVKWQITRVVYDNKSTFLPDNKELDKLLEEALIATNRCFSSFTIVSNEFGIVEG